MRIVTFGTRKLVNFGKSLYMRFVRIMTFTVCPGGRSKSTKRFLCIHYVHKQRSPSGCLHARTHLDLDFAHCVRNDSECRKVQVRTRAQNLACRFRSPGRRNGRPQTHRRGSGAGRGGGVLLATRLQPGRSWQLPSQVVTPRSARSVDTTSCHLFFGP